MKSKDRKFFQISQFFLLVFLLLVLINFNLPLSTPLSDKESHSGFWNLKSSQIHDLSGSYIEIDDTDPTKDWNWAITQVWCSGSGINTQPYVIDEVLIDGPAPDKSCITIRNSIAYFKITNCKLLNAQESSTLAGIYMENVTNGRIEFNNCSYNDKGIYLSDCSDNKITSNTITNNLDYQGISLDSGSNNNEIKFNDILNNYYGIVIYDSYSNTINFNDINDNIFHGIYLDDGYYTNITYNNVLNNERVGINLEGYSDYNNLSFNTILGQYHGIELTSSDYNSINNNTIGNCPRKYSESYGIFFQHANNNNITANWIYNVDLNGIDMWSSDGNLIQYNIIDNCNDTGINLEGCDFGEILNNSIKDCDIGGIYLLSSESNDVQGNILNNCGFVVEGIVGEMSSLLLDSSNLVNNKPVYFYNSLNNLNSANFINAGQVILYSCSNFDISSYNLYKCSIGIQLYYCSLGEISDINSAYNSIQGIRIKESDQIEIIGCNVSNNNVGIYLKPLNHSRIVENTINNNIMIGIQGDIFNAEIKNNTIKFNGDSGIILQEGWAFEESYDNITLIENIISDNLYNGLVITGSYINISSNDIQRNEGSGIFASHLSNSTISRNTILYNWDSGIKLTDCLECSITENILSSNFDPAHPYIFRTAGIEITGNAYDASDEWYECGDLVITDNIIERSRHGMYLFGTIGNEIYRNEISSTDEAFYLTYCYLSNFIENELINNQRSGVFLDESTNNSFILNDIRDTGNAFELISSSYNIFLGNLIADSGTGFELEDSSYNRITNNTILRVTQCFRERGNCIGNIFENNICEEGWDLPFSFIGAIIGLAGVGTVTGIMLIKRRNWRRSRA